jgi:hypothetical protein
MSERRRLDDNRIDGVLPKALLQATALTHLYVPFTLDPKHDIH